MALDQAVSVTEVNMKKDDFETKTEAVPERRVGMDGTASPWSGQMRLHFLVSTGVRVAAKSERGTPWSLGPGFEPLCFAAPLLISTDNENKHVLAKSSRQESLTLSCIWKKYELQCSRFVKLLPPPDRCITLHSCAMQSPHNTLAYLVRLLVRDVCAGSTEDFSTSGRGYACCSNVESVLMPGKVVG